ncbi:MAG: hypothetical protein IPH20_08645 [Bacteroidales bacterium]|nr:hypothetical protein [Bacteroidales bacterium]
MSDPDKTFQKVYNRLIPVVIVFPVIFLIFFIVVSMIQLQEINSRIEEGQSMAVKEMMNKAMAGEQFTEEYLQFLTLAALEEESLNERYRQGHYSLVSRSFKQFLGFFTGIIMVIVGSVFVLLKLKDNMDLGAQQGESWKFSLITSSPGIAFGVVGAVLIGLASLSNDKIVVRDSGLYLTREYLVAPYFSGSPRKTLDKYMLDQADQAETDEEVLIEQSPPPKNENP